MRICKEERKEEKENEKGILVPRLNLIVGSISLAPTMPLLLEYGPYVPISDTRY